MDPVTAVIVGTVVKAMADELGREVVRSLFGSRSRGDIKAIAGRLRQISRQLKEMNRKLDYIILLVKSLPQVIIGELRLELVDAAYRVIDSDRDTFHAAALQNAGELLPPTVSEQASLLAHWRTIVALESRPSELMYLPGYTEYLRARFVFDVDATFRSDLEDKLRKFDEVISELTNEIDKAIIAATRILRSRSSSIGRHSYFKKFEFPTDPPTIIYEKTTVSNPILSGPFKQRQKEAVARVEVQKTILEGRSNALQAAFAVRELLAFYIPYLLGEGTVEDVSIEWRSENPGIQIRLT